MKSRITIACLAIAAALFVVACPMPQVGNAPGRDAVGGEPGAPGGTAGSISVVNDAARGVAVYINESGQRFDVAAPEYDGGPLVTAIEVSDFTIVPPNGDADALPVKAIVVGTRDDGSPGVWQINTDDSISLPQPEQSTDTTRSIISGDMQSLPDGLQVRFGWTFKSLLTANGGKLIVGYAEHRAGFSYNGVYVAPGTKIAVYWRVSPIPFTRFCLVSSPRVIGILSAPPKPSWWPQRFLPVILVQLKQFLLGKFEAYLVTPESVQYDAATGNFTVKGLDDEGVTAVAKIDRNTVTSITEMPDLAVKQDSISFSPNPVVEGGTLALGAVVTDLTEGPALPSKLRFYLSADNKLDLDGSDLMVAETAVPAIDPMIALDSPVSASATVPAGLAVGTYYVIASVVDVTDEVVTANNTLVGATLAVTGTTSTRIYPHVVVDAFDPTTVGPIPDIDHPGEGGFPVPADVPVVVELYSAADLTNPMRTSGDGLSVRPEIFVNGFNSVSYADFGYVDASEVPSGDYYIRVSLGNSGTQAYALRVVLDPAAPDYADWVFSSRPTETGTNVDPASADPIPVGGKAARLLSGTGVANWFKLTLP